jgi:aldehyde dehydrogenase (NAD+)
MIQPIAQIPFVEAPAWIAGEAERPSRRLEVRYPYTGEITGTAPFIDAALAEKAVAAALAGGARPLSRHQRAEILERAHKLLGERAAEFANLIRLESGLCQYETSHEVGRAMEVLKAAAMEALRDDGQIFSCDVSPQGKARKIFTLREPLRAVLAITPFNHPLNQVAHKAAPAIAAGAPLLLKPSEKTPLTALRFAELLYEAGLPGWMLSVFLAEVDGVLEALIRDPRIELVTFTGSVAAGKRIASIAGYKRLCLELGGNSPLIVLDDADLELAAHLAAEGSYRNSGQRCTAVKRILVHERVAADFTARFVDGTRKYICGDPADPKTRVGTVIDENAAIRLERVYRRAIEDGAKLLYGGRRRGALLEPTVLNQVPRGAEMVVQESFGPLSPILEVRDLDDAIEVANGTAYGLASGIVTRSLEQALKAVKGIRTGSVNVNEVPGFRLESSPFGGVKDSGLGIKEGVIEALKFMTHVKTFSLPW